METKAKWFAQIRKGQGGSVAAYTDGTGQDIVAAGGFITDDGAAVSGETTTEGRVYLGKCASVADPDGDQSPGL